MKEGESRQKTSKEKEGKKRETKQKSFLLICLILGSMQNGETEGRKSKSSWWVLKQTLKSKNTVPSVFSGMVSSLWALPLPCPQWLTHHLTWWPTQPNKTILSSEPSNTSEEDLTHRKGILGPCHDRWLTGSAQLRPLPFMGCRYSREIQSVEPHDGHNLF